MKNILPTIALLLFCSMTTNLFSQTTKNIDYLRKQVKLYKDTLNFEYTGPIQEHEKIIVRVITSLYETFSYLKRNDTEGYEKYPLIKSYKKRISSIANDYLRENAKIVKVKNSYNEYYNKYELVNGLISYDDDGYYSVGERIAGNYVHFIRLYNLSKYINSSISRLINELKKEHFANLVSEATQNGIKKSATKNGFYNKELAIKLSKGVLLNKMEELLKSNKELAYKVVFIADSYIALSYLSLGVKGVQVEMILEKINKF